MVEANWDGVEAYCHVENKVPFNADHEFHRLFKYLMVA